ncbi:MAG: WbqC family protein [Paludibacteraceae bacterium]
MPYIGYISLIKHTDRFILFDTVQFIRHGWIERNRILKQNGGWQYIQVPLLKQNGRDTLIKDIKINNQENWKNKILAQIQHYKKVAPHYRRVVALIEDLFQKEYENITELNKYSLEAICKYLGFEKKIEIFSQLNLPIEPAAAPDEWALNICKAIDGADEYINPIGGLSFFDRDKYEDAGIKLYFQNMEITEYSQKRTTFEPGLSIMDVMMWNDVDEINIMLDKYTFV